MKKFIALLIFLSLSLPAFSQVENVPITNPVFEFLKEMKVKRVLSGYDDGYINLARYEVSDFLEKINKKRTELSGTEKDLLDKYRVEFIPSLENKDNTFYFFNDTMSFKKRLNNAFSDKNKHLYHFKRDKNNLVLEFVGNVFVGKEIKPEIKHNTLIMDGGLRGRGTLLGHLGFLVSFNKGVAIGQESTALMVFPHLKTDFKFQENAEKQRDYGFQYAYVKYATKPVEDLDISVQLGREKVMLGHGYGDKFLFSNNAPDMDFLKLQIKYGALEFMHLHASMPGQFLPDREDRYTKYFATNRLNVNLRDFVNFGLGEVIIYNGRIDFAYLNPLLVYLEAEKNLQDRDNKNFFIDFQTNFIKGLEFSGTYYLDDDQSFASFFGKTSIDQKIGYQIGAMAYEPLGLKDLSLYLEYTKIRPYVYSHYDIKDNYTSQGIILGHQLGPNADEIFAGLDYNLSYKVRFSADYRYRRKGSNILDDAGNVIKNVGSDVFFTYRPGIDDPDATFLEGDRINTNMINLALRFQIIRNFWFTLEYSYMIEDYVAKGYKNETSFAAFRMNVDY